MSRIGKKPISIPKEVKIDIKGDLLTVKGPKGELSRRIHPRVNIRNENDEITVTVNDVSKDDCYQVELSKFLFGLPSGKLHQPINQAGTSFNGDGNPLTQFI